MLLALLDDTMLERVRVLEERLLQLVLAPASPGTLEEEPEAEWSFVSVPPSEGARISRDPSCAPRVCAAVIGGIERVARVPVAHDGGRARTNGWWRRLPVGCGLKSEPCPAALATIGVHVIEPDAPVAAQRGAEAPAAGEARSVGAEA